MKDRAFPFIPLNKRQNKPRDRGITEIRGPYYTVMGQRYLQDILETMGHFVDSVKYAGGSFTMMPRDAVKQLNDICHKHDVLISTGGFIETVLARCPDLVDKYIEECRVLGFDIVEISVGFITIPEDDVLRLVEKVQKAGLKAKPEVGIQFGAGGTATEEELEEEGQKDPAAAIHLAKRALDAGAYMIMVESEGITESVKTWRTDVPPRFVNELGLKNVMFEAADPLVYEWYVKNYGPEVNVFIDHSQIVHLESIRSGSWGTKSLWGRVVTYKPD